MTIKAVLLDLGETLVHIPFQEKRKIEETRLRETWKGVSDIGKNVKFEKFNTALIKSSRKSKEICEKENIEIPFQIILSETLDELSLKMENDKLLKMLEKVFYRSEIEAWELFPDSILALKKIKNLPLKIGIVSNSRSDWAVREVIRKVRLDSFSDCIVTSAELGIRKPRKEPFTKTLKCLNTSSKNTVMVGDTYETDIIGAKRLGMKAIHINRGSHKPQLIQGIKPDASVTSLTEAVSIIEYWIS